LGLFALACRKQGKELLLRQVIKGNGRRIGVIEQQFFYSPFGQVPEPEFVAAVVVLAELGEPLLQPLDLIGILCPQGLQGHQIGLDDVFRGRQDIGNQVLAPDDLLIGRTCDLDLGGDEHPQTYEE